MHVSDMATLWCQVKALRTNYWAGTPPHTKTTHMNRKRRIRLPSYWLREPSVSLSCCVAKVPKAQFLQAWCCSQICLEQALWSQMATENTSNPPPPPTVGQMIRASALREYLCSLIGLLLCWTHTVDCSNFPQHYSSCTILSTLNTFCGLYPPSLSSQGQRGIRKYGPTKGQKQWEMKNVEWVEVERRN